MIRRRLLATAAALLAAHPAAAQDTVRVLPLDTLTVEVLRAPLSPLRAPFPVSSVREEEIRPGRPALSIGDALRAVPGVQVEHRYNYSLGDRISIRGFGSRAGFGVRGIRVLVDGIPATLPDGQTTLSHVDPAAIARAEVIRGPASALYGNASGGVIRLSSPPPPDAPLSSEHRVLAGAHGLRRVETSAGGRGGSFAYRANLSWLRFDGFREHQEADRRIGGGSVVWEGARDRIALTLNGGRWEAQNPGSLTDSLARADRRAAFANNVRQRTGERGSQGQAGISWRRSLGSAELEATAHALGRTLENPIPTVVIDLERRLGGVRAALTGGPERLRWTAGAESEAQRDQRRNHANLAGERGELRLDQDERVTSGSVFAQAVAAPLRGVELLGALRHDRFRFGVSDRLITNTNPDDSGTRSMRSWSPALGVSVAVAPNARLHASVATAFETPTTTELANRPDGAGGFNPELQPQRTRSIEAGAKGFVLPGAWLEATVYHATVRDALIPFEVPDAPGRVFFRNAGQSRHRGVEAAATLARPGWSVRGAYTHTDARFVRYTVRGVDLAGNRVPGVAPHRLEVSALASRGRGPWGGVDLRRSGRTPVADADAEGRFASAGHTVLDLRLGWDGARAGRALLSPFAGALNALDATHHTAVAVNAFGARYYEPGPGRSLYAGVRVSLGGRR